MCPKLSLLTLQILILYALRFQKNVICRSMGVCMIGLARLRWSKIHDLRVVSYRFPGIILTVKKYIFFLVRI